MSWLKTVLCTLCMATVLGQTNLTSYRKLPPLYSFHNYDDSIARQVPPTYCVLFAEIQPDNQSELWHSIEDLSNDTFHRFRHDYLVFGLCVEQCREMLDNSTKSPSRSRSRLLDGNATPPNEVIEYYRRVYAGDAPTRVLHHHLLDRCVNYEFQQKYNLTLRTFVEYCDTTGGKDSQIGNLEIIAYVIIALLVFSNIFSSVYDYYLKCQTVSPNPQSNDHYSQEFKSLSSSILTSFSLCRNCKKVVASNVEASDLQFTYFFRVFTIFFVIWGHALMVITAAPVANPEFIENHLYHTGTIIFQNGSTLIQIFFVLTGFLLKFKFDEQQRIKTTSGYSTCMSVYFEAFLQRYLRILPSLATLIFFNVALLTRLGSGPFWRHMVEGERVFCTEYWWKNIFMVNNFMMQESCAHQTWYLAADMQLYELFLIVLIVTSKFTSTKKPVYALLGILAFIVPGVLTYIYRLDAAPYLHPEYYRYLYFQHADTLYATYYPFYCNLGGYLVGIICAEMYTKSESFHKIKAACKKYTQVLKVQIPFLAFILSIGFGLLFTGLLVINRDTDTDPSIWVALYASCYRNLWAVFSGFALMSMLLKFGWIAYDLSCSAIFRVLGRITFQMYLWHVTILRVLFGYYRQTVYLNEFYVCCQIILAFILSMVVAFIMTMSVEYPIANIINCWLKRAMEAKGRGDDEKQNELKSYT